MGNRPALATAAGRGGRWLATLRTKRRSWNEDRKVEGQSAKLVNASPRLARRSCRGQHTFEHSLRQQGRRPGSLAARYDAGGWHAPPGVDLSAQRNGLALTSSSFSLSTLSRGGDSFWCGDVSDLSNGRRSEHIEDRRTIDRTMPVHARATADLARAPVRGAASGFD